MDVSAKLFDFRVLKVPKFAKLKECENSRKKKCVKKLTRFLSILRI